MKRKTKIICTIGPATKDKENIRALIIAGMNIARINFSHGFHQQHLLAIDNIRKAAGELDRVIPIIGDLCGPKIRIGILEGDIIITKDEMVNLCFGKPTSANNYQCLPVSYDKLNQDVKVGDSILIDDGLIELTIAEKTDTEICCRVVQGGVVKSNKGVNFPDSELSIPALTEKDKQDIGFAIEHKLEFIALSFVRNSKDVGELRDYLLSVNHPIPIIAKIEKPQAIDEIDQIIDISDVIMIARGDLGVEMNAYEVPILQKQIIHKCLLYNKPVITATQMLESMINNPRCTRAEASDVANAYFDGTDAVMLSGETSIGLHPLSAVDIMHSILLRAENTDYLRLNLFKDNTILDNSPLAIDLSKAACLIAEDIKATLIVAMTKTGRTARFLAKYRPKIPIVAFTLNKDAIPMLNITWGVEAVLMDSLQSTDEFIKQAKQSVMEMGCVQKDDIIVFVTGSPILETNEINMIKIDQV